MQRSGMAPADPRNHCRRRQTVAFRPEREIQSALSRVSKGPGGAPAGILNGQRYDAKARVLDETDTLNRAENDSPGATASGEWRSASAGAVIGSKQMMSALAGAKICAYR